MTKISDKNKKTIKTVAIVLIVLIVLAIGILIVWKATELPRLRKKTMKEIDASVENAISNNDVHLLDFGIPYDLWEDEKFNKFIASKIPEVYASEAPVNMLARFLRKLDETSRCEDQCIRDEVNKIFYNMTDIDEMLYFKDEMPYHCYYSEQLKLSRDEGPIAKYINENGIKPIETEPGKGYYANEKDSSTSHRVGLDSSPLFDATKITYKGDFKYSHYYGVRLNSDYQEESYSSGFREFRDTAVLFSEEDGDLVFSGNYLFCFDRNNGDLKDFIKVEK